MKSVYLGICCILYSLSSSAQNTTIKLVGIVLDEEAVPITEVMISINWNKKGVFSQKDGTFHITANTQDTLVLNHTSFEPKILLIKDLNTSDTLKVHLTKRTIFLDEVEIINLENWQDFKHKITTMNSDSIRATNDYRLSMMFGARKDIAIKNPYFRKSDIAPLTFINVLKCLTPFTIQKLPNIIYYHFSGEQKTREKIEQTLLQEIEVEKNAHRYSKEILMKILQIEETEAKRFKIYCDYLLDFNKNDIELQEDIKQLYKKWQHPPQLTISKKDSINYLPISNSPFNSSVSERKR